eukprot:15449286-Alexandrium_andersonii.AAC.1
MFAAIPPLEAVRCRRTPARPGSREALLVDVRKAHVHAFVEDDVYAALPPEVAQAGDRAKPNRILYG